MGQSFISKQKENQRSAPCPPNVWISKKLYKYAEAVSELKLVADQHSSLDYLSGSSQLHDAFLPFLVKLLSDYVVQLRIFFHPFFAYCVSVLVHNSLLLIVTCCYVSAEQLDCKRPFPVSNSRWRKLATRWLKSWIFFSWADDANKG